MYLSDPPHFIYQLLFVNIRVIISPKTLSSYSWQLILFSEKQVITKEILQIKLRLDQQIRRIYIEH